eukprot:g1544.t1
MVEAHDVEKTGISVDEIVGKEGKHSSGELARPIDAAATALKFDIVVYLAGKGVKGEKFAGMPMVRACEKGDLDSVKAMVEGHDVEKTGMSAGEMVSKEGENGNLNSSTPLAMAITNGHTSVKEYLMNECKAQCYGNTLVYVSETGDLDSVRVLVEGHDVEKTGMSVDEMVSKEGKDSFGESVKPIDAAVTGLIQDAAIDVTINSSTFERAANYFVAVRIDEGAKLRTEVCARTKKPKFKKNKHRLDLGMALDVDTQSVLTLGAFVVLPSKTGGKAQARLLGSVQYKLSEACVRLVRGEMVPEDLTFLRKTIPVGKISISLSLYGVRDDVVAGGVVMYLAGKGAKGEKFAGTPMVRACEKGDLDLVKAMVDGHDVEKTGMSVGNMVSKEGKNSRGDSCTPVQATTDKFIRKYLCGILAPKLVGDYMNGTPLVRACEKGRLEDVLVLVEGHDAEKTGMSVDEMVSTEGKNSNGNSRTPLQTAVRYEELEIAQYLVKSFPTVDLIGQTDIEYGENSLHCAAWKSKKDVQTLQCLIDNYNGGDIKNIINQKNKYGGETPLDYAYRFNKSSIKKDIASLLRKYGGKANRYDKNGNKVKGDDSDSDDDDISALLD